MPDYACMPWLTCFVPTPMHVSHTLSKSTSILMVNGQLADCSCVCGLFPSFRLFTTIKILILSCSISNGLFVFFYDETGYFVSTGKYNDFTRKLLSNSSSADGTRTDCKPISERVFCISSTRPLLNSEYCT